MSDLSVLERERERVCVRVLDPEATCMLICSSTVLRYTFKHCYGTFNGTYSYFFRCSNECDV